MNQLRHSLRSGPLAPPRDLGRLVARVACVVFALLGLVPPLAALLTRWAPMQQWAATETARLLDQELGLDASYSVHLSLWPLALELSDVTLRSSDGGAPALSAPRVSVRPRLFSLLGGQFDAGQIAIEEPSLRVVLRDGALANLKLRLPEAAGKSGNRRMPLGSVAITDARLSADIDGVLISSNAIDLDVFTETPQSFEVALRAATTGLITRRPKGAEAGDTEPVDEDVLCQLDARARVDRGEVLIRRLSLVGIGDTSPDANTRPSCNLDNLRGHPERLLMRLSGVRIGDLANDVPQITGHVLLQVPLELMQRYATAGPFTGWVQVSGELDVSRRTKFPEFHGKLRTGRVGLKGYTLAAHAEAELHLMNDQLLVSTLAAGYADGEVELRDVSIDLLKPGMPLVVRHGLGTGLTFPGLMRDLDVTENTIINLDLSRVVIEDFKGTLNPPALSGRLSVDAQDFAVFDRAVHDKARRHMIGVPRARIKGTFGVHTDSVRFDDMTAEFGKSVLQTSVHIGYDNTIDLVVQKGGTLELADASPLVNIPMAGRAELDVEMHGDMGDPVLTGSLQIADLWFSGFPLGNLSTDSLRFVPLVVDLERARLVSGQSVYELSRARLDFDTEATLVASAGVASDKLELRDFMAMWHFNEDPRWDGISGSGAVKGRVDYVLGGKGDPCDGGNLKVRGDLNLSRLSLFDEDYSNTVSSFDFSWFDIEASYLGMTLDVPSLSMRKGSGSLIGSFRITPGAAIHGEVIATQVPLSALQSTGPLGQRALGTLSAEAEISGTLDALAARVQARISPIRVGKSELPASQISVDLTPVAQASTRIGTTRCGAPQQAPFELGSFGADPPLGVFKTSGQLFGGQIQLSNVEITRQRAKHVRGRVAFKDFDLGAVLNLSPALAALDPAPGGRLDAVLELQNLALAKPLGATGKLRLERLSLDYAEAHVESVAPTELSLREGALGIPAFALRARTEGGQTGSFTLRGTIDSTRAQPEADLRLSLEPTALDGFVALIPGAERARGVIGGQISVTGPLSAPIYRGGFQLTNGAIYLRGSSQSLTEMDLQLSVVPGELIVEQGAFSIGGGRVTLRGNAPLTGFRLGELRAFITARGVALPLGPGVRATADADLRARWQPSAAQGALRKQALPQLVGSVVLNSFAYSRPVKMSANISDLAQRGKRTEFDAYQPEADVVSFDVTVRSQKPLLLSNNLIDASLRIEDDVLQLAGTNQRFGVRGALRIEPGGRIRLTKSEFEIQQGRVRFDDPTRISPLVDVTAVTDYRRYGGTSDPSKGPQTSAASNSGDWRITMHAHGDAETLRIDLSSQPQLSQDDIFLLLTLGLTRAEVSQVQSSTLGESVALEALGALTGADQVVTEAIPVIDEFRLGSFSSRSGRTEPAVTIGKRLSERIRAYVTSGLSEARDVRSNVEVKINRKVSIEGSYDNVNDISSSTLGNLGADIRWRLDFQ